MAAAFGNPNRTILRVLATENAQRRLSESIPTDVTVEPTNPKALSKLLGDDAVHQGIAIEVEPLVSPTLDALADTARLVLFLDQITDPHNVGAILRSAAAMAVDAVVVTARHSPVETGVLAKSASGALDVVPLITVGNLARALEEVGERGFLRIGLDSEGERRLEEALTDAPLALVLGAEGKGLRQKTMLTCDTVCRLELPGVVTSLNVSNAAAIALYLAKTRAA